ncbi:NAD(P)-binding protein [Coniophora puteana RWD-64-598 SS2]|uniref:NAD(P)-binding protein n=1 Tax=Coniophora puteana (strain RWD-64-598) TaxID=741705 RepID=A0A5M3N7X3_CONPW|nr:NAD(P)-binding protein [Coniophora puteana RWD-64-598 SS2]EIW86945.1 NAD(P)-binding protein [Coniophora puteana RWD-64-598 SS2]
MQQDAIPFSRPTTPRPALQIGWYGLGAMGYYMARNLSRSRPSGAAPLLVFNRTASKSDKLVQDVGSSAARAATSLAQLAVECDIVFTNLANDAVVEQTYNEFAKALTQAPPTKSKIFVDTSTVYPTLAGDIDRLLSTFSHCHFVTSPIFGPPPAADSAKLVIALSGDHRLKKEIAHLLVPAVGRKVMDLGGNIEKAPTFKLIGNSLIMGANELLAEAFTFGEKAGIGQQTVLNLVKDIMPAPGMVAYGEKMVADKFDGSVGFAINGGIKDANHIRRLTAELNSPMPAVDVAHQRMIAARAIFEAQKAAGTNKWDIIDWSALIAGSRVAAGLDPFDSSKGKPIPDN